VKRRTGSWWIFLCVFGGAMLVATVALAQFATPPGKYAGTAGSSCAGLGQQYAWPDPNGQILQCVSSIWTVVSPTSISGGLTLGTSAAVANPARVSEANTGLYSAGSGKVDVTLLGTQMGELSSTGLNLGTTAALSGSLKLGGINGISFPAGEVLVPGASIAIGSTALAHLPALSTAFYGDVAIGYEALGGSSMTTAAMGNTAVGGLSMSAITSGAGNTAFGYGSLAAGTSAVSNTAVGYGALELATSANNNTATGNEAMFETTSGGSNTAFGLQTLFNNTTGNFNTALGAAALGTSTTGSNNTAVGFGAGYTITTGTSNLALGLGVASTTLNTGSGNILIGGSAVVDTPLPGTNSFLNIGNTIFATGTNVGTLTAPAGHVGIGTITPLNLLQVNSSTSGSGTASQIRATANKTGSVELLAYSNVDNEIELNNDYNGTNYVAVGTTAVNIIQTAANGLLFFMTNGLTAGSTYTITNAQMALTYAGRLGIGTALPQSLLQTYNGEVQIGSSGASCATANNGALRFSGSTVYVCTGTTWTSVGSGGGGGSVNFGTGVTANSGTNYLASSAGVVVAFGSRNTANCILTGKSDGTTTPSTVVAEGTSVATTGDYISITFPVISGNYYSVTQSGCTNYSGLFYPLTGSGGSGSGTVNIGSQYQMGYYAANGSTLSGDASITTDSNNDLLVSSGDVGVGTATPVAPVNVVTSLSNATAGSVAFWVPSEGANVINYPGVLSQVTATQMTIAFGETVGSMSIVEDPVSNTNAVGFTIGVLGVTRSDSNVALNYGSEGLDGEAYLTGTIDQSGGALVGVNGVAENDPGAVNAGAVVGGAFYANGDGGTVANGVTGIESFPYVAVGTVTNGLWGIYDEPNIYGGSVDFRMGLFLAAGVGTPSGTAPNDYGIYQESTTAVNYFGGNVGIKMTNPGNALTVGATAASGPTIAANNTQDPFQIAFTNTLGFVIGGGSAAPFPVWLQTYDTGTNGLTFPLALNPLGGGVAIGTTDTLDQLTVLTDFPGDSDGIWVQNTDATGQSEIDIANYNNSAVFYIGLDSTTTRAYIGNSANSSLDFETDATERMVITGGGNVGIGTTVPTAPLTVVGASGSDALLLNTNISGYGGMLEIYNANAGAGDLTIFQGGSSASSFGWINDSSVIESQATGGLLLSAYSATNITFDTGSRVPRMTITNTGNVGIGTSNPGALFTVGNNAFEVNSSGAVTAGSWTGTTVAVAHGGTGVTTSTGTGNTVLSAAPTFSGTVTVAALSATGLTAGATGHDVICATGTTGTVTFAYGASATSCTPSSQRYKHDIVALPASAGLGEVRALNPVSYYYNEDKENKRQYAGFIAEQVNAVDPRPVEFDKEGRPNALDYSQLIPLDTKAIKQIDTAFHVENIDSETAATISSWYQGANAPAITIDAAGNVGIGTLSPRTPLHVYTSGTGALETLQSGSATCVLKPGTDTMTTSCSSDVRLKKDIVDTDDKLSWLNDMHIRDYTVRVDNSRTTGVVAQELLPTHPDMVHMGADGFYTVDDPNPWKLVKALQELKADNDNLRAANDNEVAQIKKLTARLDALEAARR
jgi:hypothetical protein